MNVQRIELRPGDKVIIRPPHGAFGRASEKQLNAIANSVNDFLHSDQELMVTDSDITIINVNDWSAAK